MKLFKSIFETTENFPKSEIYNLTSQINRSTISVSSNIAEGSSRNSNKGFKRYLEISLGSLYELQTQIILANYQQYISNESLGGLELKIEELQKMIHGFQNSLK